jgi:hypothetical protein
MNRPRGFTPHTLIAVVASLLLAPPGAQSQLVSGVAMGLDSSAVAGITMTLRTSSGQIAATARSAGDGSFQLAIPENGQYRIRGDAPGYLPTESLLFELRADGRYAIDMEMTPSMSQSVPDLPRERYEEWVRKWVDSWQTRDVEMVLGQQWRDAAAGRDLLEALRQTDLPLRRWEPHPRFSGRICPRTRSSTQCASVAYLTHGSRGDLRDVPPSEIEAVIWIGSMISSGPSPDRMAWDARFEVERVILFSRGYLAQER